MLKPCLRTRYRYVEFKVIGPDKDKIDNVEKLMHVQLVKLVGILGASEIGITVTSKGSVYYVKVKRDYADYIKGVIALINCLGRYNARPQIVKTYGTIKKLIKK